ncbi:hypothetical protein V8C35DRAFT_126121 [Trichoderma chlorosporum]
MSRKPWSAVCASYYQETGQESSRCHPSSPLFFPFLRFISRCLISDFLPRSLVGSLAGAVHREQSQHQNQSLRPRVCVAAHNVGPSAATELSRRPPKIESPPTLITSASKPRLCSISWCHSQGICLVLLLYALNNVHCNDNCLHPWMRLADAARYWRTSSSLQTVRQCGRTASNTTVESEQEDRKRMKKREEAKKTQTKRDAPHHDSPPRHPWRAARFDVSKRAKNPPQVMH